MAIYIYIGVLKELYIYIYIYRPVDRADLREHDGAFVRAVNGGHQPQNIRPRVPLSGEAPVRDRGGNLDVVLPHKIDELRGV